MAQRPSCDHNGFLQFWRTLPRGDAGVPYRSSLNPSAIPQLLPFYFLLERTSRTHLEVRIMGTALDGFLPSLNRGKNFFDVYREHQKEFYYQLIADMCEQPCGCMMSRTVNFSDQTTMTVKSITLPMSSADGDVKYLTGLAEAPPTGQMLGLAGTKSRVGSEVTDFYYIDIGKGLPSNPPIFPQDPVQR